MKTTFKLLIITWNHGKHLIFVEILRDFLHGICAVICSIRDNTIKSVQVELLLSR